VTDEAGSHRSNKDVAALGKAFSQQNFLQSVWLQRGGHGQIQIEQVIWINVRSLMEFWWLDDLLLAANINDLIMNGGQLSVDPIVNVNDGN